MLFNKLFCRIQVLILQLSYRNQQGFISIHMAHEVISICLHFFSSDKSADPTSCQDGISTWQWGWKTIVCVAEECFHVTISVLCSNVESWKEAHIRLNVFNLARLFTFGFSYRRLEGRKGVFFKRPWIHFSQWIRTDLKYSSNGCLPSAFMVHTVTTTCCLGTSCEFSKV